MRTLIPLAITAITFRTLAFSKNIHSLNPKDFDVISILDCFQLERLERSSTNLNPVKMQWRIAENGKADQITTLSKTNRNLSNCIATVVLRANFSNFKSAKNAEYTFDENIFIEAENPTKITPPTKKVDVNRTGLLGLSGNTSPKKDLGIAPDKFLVNSAVDPISGTEKNLLLKQKRNPPGDIETGNQGSPRSNGLAFSTLSEGGKDSLSASQNSDAGGKLYNPSKAAAGLGKRIGGSKGGGGLGALGDPGSGFDVSGGGLDRNTVKSVIDAYKPAFQACHNKALLSQPKLMGSVVMKWTVTVLPSGDVSQAQVVRTEAKSQFLESCLKLVMLDMKFPVASNNQSTIVSYPFTFTQKE